MGTPRSHSHHAHHGHHHAQGGGGGGGGGGHSRSGGRDGYQLTGMEYPALHDVACPYHQMTTLSAVLKIQSVWRGFTGRAAAQIYMAEELERRWAVLMDWAGCKVQNAWRCTLARRVYLGMLAQAQVEKEKVMVVIMQKYYRGARARRQVAVLREEEEERVLLEKKNKAATTLARFEKGRQHRKSFNFMRHDKAARTIQTAVRHALKRKKQRSIVEAQHALHGKGPEYKRKSKQKKQGEPTKAAIKMQKALRGMQARRWVKMLLKSNGAQGAAPGQAADNKPAEGMTGA